MNTTYLINGITIRSDLVFKWAVLTDLGWRPIESLPLAVINDIEKTLDHSVLLPQKLKDFIDTCRRDKVLETLSSTLKEAKIEELPKEEPKKDHRLADKCLLQKHIIESMFWSEGQAFSDLGYARFFRKGDGSYGVFVKNKMIPFNSLDEALDYILRVFW